MSSKRSKAAPEVLFEDVFEAVASTEEEYHVHIHYVIRRHPAIRKRGSGRIILFVRRLGLGSEARTVGKQELSFPTPDGRSMSAVLLYLVNIAARELEDQRMIAEGQRAFFDESPTAG